MVGLKCKNIILIFCILGMFVSHRSPEGAPVDENNQIVRSENGTVQRVVQWSTITCTKDGCSSPVTGTNSGGTDWNIPGASNVSLLLNSAPFLDLLTKSVFTNGQSSSNPFTSSFVSTFGNGKPLSIPLSSDFTSKASENVESSSDVQISSSEPVTENVESSTDVQISSSEPVSEHVDSRSDVQSGPGKPGQDTCILPPYPLNGKYEAFHGSKPGDAVSSTFLTYTCGWGYSLSGNSSRYCISGTWVSEEPTCEIQCPPLKSISVDFKCYKQHSTLEISCDVPQDNNSRAKPECKDSYHLEPPPRDLRCIQGNWDYIPRCTPECGTLAPDGNLLVIGGEIAKIGEFPWHVGIYDKTENPITQICGGSIFYPNLVVTAAHCVFKEGVGLHPASTFAVAAGKVYRRWNALREDDKYVQTTNVVRIEIPDRYRGAINAYTADIAILVLERSFLLNSFIRPICIKFDFVENLDGQFGKVAGWGLTAEDGHPSALLRTVTLPYVNYQDCFRNSPQSFRPLITSDKICAGYTNGTALCNGDSGGGLVFTRNNGFQDIHYLYGIVSTSSRGQSLTSCSIYAYTAFTDVNDRNIQNWFKYIWSTHYSLE